QCFSILLAERAAGAIRSLGVYTNALQKNWLAVQKYLCSARFDGAESHLIFQPVFPRRQDYTIEHRVFRRPKLQLGIHKMNRGLSVGLCFGRDAGSLPISIQGDLDF